MPVTYISDHVPQALARLATQYQGQANIEGLVEAFVGRIQVLENVVLTLNTQRQLYGDTAVGAQLDVLGALAGIARGGLDDTTYYVLILGTIAQNNSNASLNAILNVAKTIFQASEVYATTPNAPGHARRGAFAELSLAVADPKTPRSLVPLLVRILQATLGGGVTLVSISQFDSAGAVSGAGSQPWVSGFGSISGAPGGTMAGVLYTNPLA